MRSKTIMRICMVMVCLLILTALTGCGNSQEAVEKTNTEGSKTTIASPVSTKTPIPTIKATPTPTPTASPKAQVNAGIGYVNEENVNLREKALVSSTSLAKLARNTKVTVIKHDAGNGWSEIEYEGKSGFVATRYVTMVGDEDILDDESTGVIMENGVNIRTEATTSSKSLGTLSKDAKVTIIKKDAGGGWSLILYGGRLVYIATKYIKLD
ncbi:MAG: SH3 domain-containing protein [Christensenellales bacterium]